MMKIKTITLLFFCGMLTLQSAAQKPDSLLASRYRPGIMWFFDGMRSSSLVDARKYDRLIIDLLYNSWKGGSQKAFAQHWGSIGFNTQLFFDIPLTPRNTVSLGIGLGYGHTHIRYDQALQRVDSLQATVLADLPAGIDKSVFRSNQLFVPVELRLRTPGWRHAKLHIGGRIGYRFGSSTSLFTKVDGLRTENRTAGFHDLDPLLLSAHARLGIRNWALTASYNLRSYFKSAQSTRLAGLEVGLSISLF